MNLFAIAALGKSVTAKDSKIGIGGLIKIGLMLLTVPTLIVAIIVTAIIYFITTPLSAVLELFTDAGVEMPEAVKDFKSETAFLTYTYVTGNSLSPPTYNNVVLKDYDPDNHPGITFKGTSLFWKRYAYSIDVGTVEEITEDSITIKHLWGQDEETGEDLVYYAYYEGVAEEEGTKEKDKLSPGMEVLPGRRLAAAKLFARIYFEIRDAENNPVNPNEFITLDDVELAPDSDDEAYTAT